MLPQNRGEVALTSWKVGFDQRSTTLDKYATADLDRFVAQVLHRIATTGDTQNVRIDIEAGGNGPRLLSPLYSSNAARRRADKAGNGRAQAIDTYVSTSLRQGLAASGKTPAEVDQLMGQLMPDGRTNSVGRAQPRQGTVSLVKSFGLDPVAVHQPSAMPPVMLSVDFQDVIAQIPARQLRRIPGLGTNYQQIKANLLNQYPRMRDNADPMIQWDDANQRLAISYHPYTLLGVYPQLARHLSALAARLRPHHRGERELVMINTFGTVHGRDYVYGEGAALTEAGRRKAHNFDYGTYNAIFTDNAIRAFNNNLPKLSPRRAASALLKNNSRGFIIGDVHDRPDTWRYLQENLADLATRHKIGTLYVEGLYREQQPLLDAYFASADEKPSGPLAEFMTRSDASWKRPYPTNMTGVLELAKSLGVRVVGTDDLSSVSVDIHDFAIPEDWAAVRGLRNNTMVESIIAGDAAGRAGKKYIVVTGLYHAHTAPGVTSSQGARADAGVPGLSQVLNIPAVLARSRRTAPAAGPSTGTAGPDRIVTSLKFLVENKDNRHGGPNAAHGPLGLVHVLGSMFAHGRPLTSDPALKTLPALHAGYARQVGQGAGQADLPVAALDQPALRAGTGLRHQLRAHRGRDRPDHPHREGPRRRSVETCRPSTSWSNYTGQKLRTAKDFGQITNWMINAGRGSAGLVVVYTEGNEIGHVFNVTYGKHGVVFLDGQTGKLAVLPAGVSELKFVPSEGTFRLGNGESRCSPAPGAHRRTRRTSSSRRPPRKVTAWSAWRRRRASCVATKPRSTPPPGWSSSSSARRS